MRFTRGGAAGVAAASAFAVVAAIAPGSAATVPTNTAARPAVSQAVQGVSPAGAVQATSKKGTISSRVDGTFRRSGTVHGHFTPHRFIEKRGAVYATGVLHATLRRGDGTLIGKAHRWVTLPIARGATSQLAAQATSCQVLHLVLGPLDLNLLGLMVHLDKVVLDITAVPGPGNLLGNLICAVAHLLDGQSTLLNLLKLSNVLNRILTILHA